MNGRKNGTFFLKSKITFLWRGRNQSEIFMAVSPHLRHRAMCSQPAVCSTAATLTDGLGAATGSMTRCASTTCIITRLRRLVGMLDIPNPFNKSSQVEVCKSAVSNSSLEAFFAKLFVQNLGKSKILIRLICAIKGSQEQAVGNQREIHGNPLGLSEGR